MFYYLRCYETDRTALRWFASEMELVLLKKKQGLAPQTTDLVIQFEHGNSISNNQSIANTWQMTFEFKEMLQKYRP